MPNDLEDRLDAMEKRVARLEEREGFVRRLLRPGPDDPEAGFALDYEFNRRQITEIADIMESAHQKLARGELLEARDFEKQLLPYCPAKLSSYDFVKLVLMTFGQWNAVVDHFSSDFNVPTGRPRKS